MLRQQPKPRQNTLEDDALDAGDFPAVKNFIEKEKAIPYKSIHWQNFLEKVVEAENDEAVSYVATLYKQFDLGIEQADQIINKAQKAYTPQSEQTPSENQKKILNTLENIKKISQARKKTGLSNMKSDDFIGSSLVIGQVSGGGLGFVVGTTLLATGILGAGPYIGIVFGAMALGMLIAAAIGYAIHKNKTKKLAAALAAIPNEISNNKTEAANVTTYTNLVNLTPTPSVPPAPNLDDVVIATPTTNKTEAANVTTYTNLVNLTPTPSSVVPPAPDLGLDDIVTATSTAPSATAKRTGVTEKDLLAAAKGLRKIGLTNPTHAATKLPATNIGLMDELAQAFNKRKAKP